MQTEFDSRLSATEIMGCGVQNMPIATGAVWLRDGVARQHIVPVPIAAGAKIYTPDDLVAGDVPTGTVVMFDDGHSNMGAVMAEFLVKKGMKLTLNTPSTFVSGWTNNTLEQQTICRRLDALGVDIVLDRGVAEIAACHAVSDCVYTGKTRDYAAGAVYLVASRVANDQVYYDLLARQAEWADAGILSVKLFGDAKAAGPIAWQPMQATAMPGRWTARRLPTRCPFAARLPNWHPSDTSLAA